MNGPWRPSRAGGARRVGGRRGRRAVARIEKLVVARATVERKLNERIERAVHQARARGVPWSLIGRTLGSTPWRLRRRYRRAAERNGSTT